MTRDHDFSRRQMCPELEPVPQVTPCDSRGGFPVLCAVGVETRWLV